MKKLFGFTLAEVLIVITVIGVVAALTLPSLITKYSKKVYIGQLKKEYSNITNGFKTILGQEGVERLSETSIWRQMDSDGASSGYMNSAVASKLEEIFNVASPGSGSGSGAGLYYEDLSGNSMDLPDTPVYFADGSSIAFTFYKRPEMMDKEANTKLKEMIGLIVIDVNGDAAPNIYGRDAFAYVLENDGTLYPYGGADWALANGCEKTEDGFGSCDEYYWGSASSSDGIGCESSSGGLGCAGRIQDEGWTMKY